MTRSFIGEPVCGRMKNATGPARRPCAGWGQRGPVGDCLAARPHRPLVLRVFGVGPRVGLAKQLAGVGDQPGATGGSPARARLHGRASRPWHPRTYPVTAATCSVRVRRLLGPGQRVADPTPELAPRRPLGLGQPEELLRVAYAGEG